MLSPRRVVRNARLLLQSALQHLVDDPALLAVQVSRRMPFKARIRAGGALLAVASRIPSGGGVAALGAHMAGDEASATEQIARGARSRLGGEVAILLQRTDLLPEDSSPVTRARAAWARGDLSAALRILETAGKGQSRYARRIRSELALLNPGYRLPVTAVCTTRPDRARGEKLRVLHLLTNSLPHTQSGYSLRSHRILTSLAQQGINSVALTRTGYPVMIGSALAEDEDIVDGIRYVRTLPSRLPQTQEDRLQAEVARALELVDEFRPHVLHATTNYYNALVARAISDATGIPWVLEVRGLMEQTWTASRKSASEREMLREAEKVRLVASRESELAADAVAVVTLSETMRDELIHRGVPARAITVVPNGVESALLSRGLSPTGARARIDIDVQDAIVVGTVSALVGYEGLDVLLRASARLIADDRLPRHVRDKLRVLIVGDGVAAPGLRLLARELGIEDRVTMPGRVSRESAPDWVQALDIVVVPRLDVDVARTVTPQKPIEAMALGRPVIISDLPALVETVTGKNGTVCAVTHRAGSAEGLADAIVSMIENPDLTAERVARGLDVATSRTWSSLITRYAGLYTAVSTEEGNQRA
ncbi:glycosyltransferase family 4 protein [Brachybacterium paraconglomeratum]|uniref:glycosyltransferase family 4 protein n=1 Tax=Brachybacterium paraconglomeratum TaxID=173362 RepID=UPI0037C84B3D